MTLCGVVRAVCVLHIVLSVACISVHGNVPSRGDAMAEAHMCIGEEGAHRTMTSSVTGHLSLLRHQSMPSCAEIVPPSHIALPC